MEGKNIIFNFAQAILENLRLVESTGNIPVKFPWGFLESCREQSLGSGILLPDTFCSRALVLPECP